MVQITGSGSDAETAVAYTWSQISGPAVVLSSITTARTSFEAPLVPIGTTSTVGLRLTVSDTASASTTDDVAVFVGSNDYVVYNVSHGAGGGTGLYTYSPETGVRSTLRDPLTNGGFNQVKVAPSRSRIAYVGNDRGLAMEDLYTVLPDGSGKALLNAATPFTHAVSQYQWSPDGSRIAYTAAQDLPLVVELYTVQPDGGSRVKINAAAAADGGVLEFAWSPDGSRLAFVALLASESRWQVYASRADGTGFVKLSDAQAGLGVAGLRFSPDGSRIAYGQYAAAGIASEVFTVRPDGTDRIRVIGPLIGTANARDWEWSPSSSYLAANIDMDVNNKFEIFAVRADGEQFTKISPTVTYSWIGPSSWEWLPNGLRLGYTTDYGSDGIQDLESAAPDGTARITWSQPGGSPTLFFDVAPNGERIVYLKSGHAASSDAFTVRADGTGRVRLNDDLPPGALFPGFPAWAPDSSLLAFVAEQTVAGLPELFAIRPDGTGRVLVDTGVQPAYFLRWAPNSSRVLYKKRRSPTASVPDLFSALRDGTGIALLSPLGTEGVRPEDPVWSPDGDRVLYLDESGSGGFELHVVRADGTGDVQINVTPTSATTISLFEWAP